MRVSKCSRLSLFTCGERNTQKMRRFVGSGTGPETRASVAFAASRILSHALCMWFVSKDRRRMRILDACTAAACAVAARAFVCVDRKPHRIKIASVIHRAFAPHRARRAPLRARSRRDVIQGFVVASRRRAFFATHRRARLRGRGAKRRNLGRVRGEHDSRRGARGRASCGADARDVARREGCGARATPRDGFKTIHRARTRAYEAWF